MRQGVARRIRLLVFEYWSEDYQLAKRNQATHSAACALAIRCGTLAEAAAARVNESAR